MSCSTKQSVNKDLKDLILAENWKELGIKSRLNTSSAKSFSYTDGRIEIFIPYDTINPNKNVLFGKVKNLESQINDKYKSEKYGSIISIQQPKDGMVISISSTNKLINALNQQYDEQINIPDMYFHSRENEVNKQLKSIEILQSDKAKQVFEKGEKNKWSIDKILNELQIPKEQKQLILDLGKTNREEIITDLLANYSYTVEINTAKENHTDEGKDSEEHNNLNVPGGTNYKINVFKTPLIIPSIINHFFHKNQIGWFRSDDRQRVKGVGVYSKEQADRDLKEGKISEFEYEMASESFGIESATETDTKTRRILEVQSDLFQKGRDKKDLISKENINEGTLGDSFELNGYKYVALLNDDIYVKASISNTNNYENINEKEYKDSLNEYNKLSNNRLNKNENQFLQLLNKDNNWVTFFVKSIIQDSQKKGYEKVLFPKLDTIIQIESEGKFKTYEEAEKFYKTPEWIAKNDKAKKELYEAKALTEQSERFIEISKHSTYNFKEWKNNAVQRAYENWHSLQPSLLNTAKFYENDITNILKKQGYNPTLITDEYGNTWNEIDLSNEKVKQQTEIIFHSRENINEENNLEDLQAPITDNFLDLVRYKKAQLEQIDARLNYLKRIKNLSSKLLAEKKQLSKDEKLLESQITELTDSNNTIEFMYNAVFTQLEDIKNSIENGTIDFDKINSEIQFLESFITGEGKEENDFSIFKILRDDYKKESKLDKDGKEYTYDRGYKSLEILLNNTKKSLEEYIEKTIDKLLTGDTIEKFLTNLNTKEIKVGDKVEKNPDYYKSRGLLNKNEDYILTEEDIRLNSRNISTFSKYMLGLDDSATGGGSVLATQIMKQQYVTTQNYYINFIADITEKIKALEEKIDNTDFLYKKDEDGKKTLFLTSLYSNKWNKFRNDLTKSFGKFYFENNWKLKKSQYQKISRNIKNNGGIINPAKLLHFKTLMQDNPEYDSRYAQYFIYSDLEMLQYEKELKDLLGPMYDLHIKQLEETVNYFDELITETEISSAYVEQTIYKNNIWEYIKNMESFGGGIMDKMPIGHTSKGNEMLFQNFKSLVIIPKNSILGQSTNYYDENFKKDMQNVNKFNLWLETKKMCEFISEEYSDSIVGSEDIMLPFLVDSFKSSLANTDNITNLIKNKGEQYLTTFQEIFSKNTKKDTKDTSFIRKNYINEAQNRIRTKANLYQAQGLTRDEAYKKAEQDVLSNLKEDTLLRDLVAVGNLAAQHAARQATLPIAKLLATHLSMKDTMSQDLYQKYNAWFRQNILNTSILESNSDSFANRNIGKLKILSLEEKKLKREFKRLKELNKIGSTNKVNINRKVGDTQFNFGYTLDEEGNIIYIVDEQQVNFDKYQEEYDKYIDAEINNLGINLNLMGLINGFMKIKTTAALGFNIVSAGFNRTEGIHTNSLVDSTGEYWTPGNDIKSKKALQFTNVNHYFGKYNKFQSKESNDFNRQFKKLLEHFSSIQDKRNELEKAEDVVDMSFSIKNFDFGKMLMAWSQERPEFKNQGQVILNMLQDLTVERDGKIIQFFDGDKFNGIIENADGSISLHPDFQNEFESLSSEKMLKEYSIIATVLNRTHGNYDKNDTVLTKGKLETRMAMQFKNWLGSHIMQRYLDSQDKDQLNLDLATGKLRQDGRHIKFLKNHPYLAGLNMISSMANTRGGNIAMFTGLATVGGLATGGILLLPSVALWVKANLGNKKLFDLEVKDTMNLAIYLREVLLNTLNYVPKTVLSKDLLEYTESKSNTLKNRVFNNLTQDDIRNLQTMAQEMSIQLSTIAFKIMLYSIFSSLLDSDDEDKKSTLNVTHNFLQNQLTRLSTSIGSWSSLPVVGPFLDNTKISLMRDIEKAYNLLGSDNTSLGKWIGFTASSTLGIPTHLTKYGSDGLLPWEDKNNYDVKSLNRNFKWVHDNFYLDDEDRAKKEVKKIRDEKKEKLKDIILEEFQNEEQVNTVLKALMKETIGVKDKDMSYEETLEILNNEGVLNTKESREYISNKLSEQGMSNSEIQEKMTNIYSKLNR
jgi:hypothetical protein